ncbi:MAG: hypothetical protein LBG96_03115 [Tannerella sp.]|jgi:hypothetical protein|nr:hypothetical protein [Tannerella sp.]
MSGFIKMLLLMLSGGAFCSAYTAAQDTVGIGWKDYDYIRRTDTRLSAYNATGIRYLPVNRIAIANLYANKSDGKFINYYQSEDSYKLGAQTESYYRLSPEIVFYGSVSYENFTGKNMGGSVFINPYYNPFDMVEYSDTTQGKKNLEAYHLTGAISADLTERLTIGGKIDYHAANYAKQKDLRHKNKLLDMFVTAGLSYRINNSIEIGANYYYRRSVEGVEFKTYGTSDKRYTSLVSYGAFFGKTEQFGETGYTTSGENNPMYNNFHGASLQLGINLAPEIHFFNELTCKSRDGEFGKRTPYMIVYSEHNSDIIEYRGSFSLKKSQNHQLVNLYLENETLENFENVYKFETQPGGYTHIIYYDPLKVADKEQFHVKAEYIANLGVKDFCPALIFRGGIDFYQNKQTLSLYPYYRKQTIRYTHYNAAAVRNIINGKNMYSISIDARYASGGGTIFKDSEYATPGENQTKPKYNDKNLQTEYEYLTAGQIKTDIGLKYSRLLDPIGITGYAAINYSLTKGFDVEYHDGDNFNSITFTVGSFF